MIKILRQHLIDRLTDDLENLDHVLNFFVPIKAERNTYLVEEGHICKNVYFVAKGCLQVFVYDHNMNETTRDIVTEGSWCSELISFGSGKPATENIKTVEPCELLAINKLNFQELLKTVPQFDRVYKQILEASYANSVFRINTFVALSALDRIKWLMENRPKLMSRVPGKLIASYLGINKDVFSRLKAKL